MDFKPRKILIEAIENKNVGALRVAIKAYISSNPADTKGETKAALEYIKKHDINIWEVHEELGKKDKNEWDDKYLALLLGELMYNFSEERFNFISEVSRYIYIDEVEKVNQENRNKTNETKGYKSSKSSGENVNLQRKKHNSVIALIVVAVMGIAAVVKMMK